jgi:hypothetical protein
LAEDDAPKSAYEIILERLKRQDREQGLSETLLSGEQRARIAELRRLYEAKLAEREILYRSALRKAGGEPEAVEQLEQTYRRDRERITAERERKLEQVRAGGG